MFVLIFTLLSAGSLAAQERTVTLSGRVMSIRDVLREIEEQTDYRFTFGHSNFDINNIVELTDSRASVKAILAELLEGTDRTYRMESSTQILFIPVMMEKQERSGMVVLPFDWSKSYSDSDFERDVAESLLRREGTGGQDRKRVEVTVEADSVFHYSSREVSLQIGRNGRWLPVSYGSKGNFIAVKTNILHTALALAPNIALELATGAKTTLDISSGLNLWNRKGSDDDNRKLIHTYVRPEFRYWTCGRFGGHFFGVNAFYWQYNVSGHKVPWMFESKYQYEGNAFGAGMSYGYHWMLGRRWGVEFNAGVGVAFMKYDKFECARCGDFIDRHSKTYFGPTSLGIKLVYIIK